MKLLMKEWKLCMHPMGYFMLLCSALILVPGYPYGVSCFYMGLAIYFICLTARENHDAVYTLTLPVSRRDAVRARILFCAALQAADLLLIGLFILVKNQIGCMPNPAGLDAGVALLGEAAILFAVHNMIFFPLYYRDISKPGLPFLAASAAVFLCIIGEIVGTYTVPFLRDVLDRPDPLHMGDKLLFTLGGFALFAGGTCLSFQHSVRRFEEQDLSL